jgi:hypothetical protein
MRLFSEGDYRVTPAPIRRFEAAHQVRNVLNLIQAGIGRRGFGDVLDNAFKVGKATGPRRRFKDLLRFGRDRPTRRGRLCGYIRPAWSSCKWATTR